jgi:hypothetical protein
MDSATVGILFAGAAMFVAKLSTQAPVAQIEPTPTPAVAPTSETTRQVKSDDGASYPSSSKPVGKFEYMFDPKYNMREAAKQLILLEDHIAFPTKQCPDCVRKHLLFTEGLLEEAVTLDKVGAHSRFVLPLLTEFRRLCSAFARERFARATYLQQGFRTIRKKLQNYAFDVVA